MTTDCVRHSAATSTSNETPAGHRDSSKDCVEATFSYILDAQSNLAVLAHACGTPLEFHLGLNHLLFNAGEDPSPFLQSQTQASSEHLRGIDAQPPPHAALRQTGRRLSFPPRQRIAWLCPPKFPGYSGCPYIVTNRRSHPQVCSASRHTAPPDFNSNRPRRRRRSTLPTRPAPPLRSVLSFLSNAHEF